MGKSKANIAVIIGIAAVVCALVFGGLFVTRNIGKTDRVIDQENAEQSLARMVKDIGAVEGTPVKSAVEASDSSDEADELPDIDTKPLVVEPTTDYYAEIFASGEKSGTGTDGWLCEVADAFNSSGIEINGKRASIAIRKVSSGEGLDYISSGKYMPDGYTPSNKLWINMLDAKGVKTETVADRLVGNTAGIVLENSVNDKIKQEYGQVDLKAICDGTVSGDISIGYTNPFTSAAGLNFLMSMLMRYDASNPLSQSAVEGFTSFQKNVPFVAMTTQQMRDASQRSVLDGFVTESQVYENDQALKAGYTFTPFGFRHDNPLVTFESTPQDKKDIISEFAEYALSDKSQAIATSYGFNSHDDYNTEFSEPDGTTLLQAQALYKSNKDAGRGVYAVFVADVSGSMDGDPISAMKESLLNSMQYITKGNQIGLVSYADSVTIDLPIAEWDLNQMSYFKGAVESLRAGGNTATYDALVVAIDMLEKATADDPEARKMVFLLSDGEQNQGYSLRDITDIVKGLRIPIYTIGYNANIDALKQVSSINEAASIDASTEDVVYQLKTLFNANM